MKLSFTVVMMCGLASFALAADNAAQIERGKYLVEEVAKCQDCHTPRLETGELDKSKWLAGATLDFQPIKPVEGWHAKAPNLRPDGRYWKAWGEEGLIKFMSTGLNPKGKPADPPMPAYKMTKEDAAAVIAYLKSLPPSQ